MYKYNDDYRRRQDDYRGGQDGYRERQNEFRPRQNDYGERQMDYKPSQNDYRGKKNDQLERPSDHRPRQDEYRERQSDHRQSLRPFEYKERQSDHRQSPRQEVTNPKSYFMGQAPTTFNRQPESDYHVERKPKHRCDTIIYAGIFLIIFSLATVAMVIPVMDFWRAPLTKLLKPDPTALAGVVPSNGTLPRSQMAALPTKPFPLCALLANVCFLLMGMLALYAGLKISARSESVVFSVMIGIVGCVFSLIAAVIGGIDLNLYKPLYGEGLKSFFDLTYLNLAWATYALTLLNFAVALFLSSFSCYKTGKCTFISTSQQGDSPMYSRQQRLDQPQYFAEPPSFHDPNRGFHI